MSEARLRDRASAFWTVPYSPLRAFWLLRGCYLLLCVDLWFEMIQHGGRYGLGDFNVAHFGFLDALLPLPTPPLYVGLLIASGAFALLLALGPAPRWLRLLLAASYTVSWVVSVHDSYQHHYFLSWLLCWCAAVPDLTVRRALSREPVTGWGLPMTALTCAIVYFFTGISKSEPDWRSGQVLRALTRSAVPGAAHPGKFDGARDLLLSVGLDDAGIWQLFALSTIALQWLVTLGYLASTARDSRPSAVRTWLCTLGLLAALSFHAVAELFHVFEIGLFSYYMMLLACLLLAPAQLWWWPTRALQALTDVLARVFAREHASPSTRRADSVRAAIAALLLLASGVVIPLPGALAATCAVALAVALCIAAAARRAEGRAAALDRLTLTATVTAFALWLALTRSSVPFDYYRRTAGELVRMGQLERALSQYRLAERYAPADHSRLSKIRELEAELRKSSPKRRL